VWVAVVHAVPDMRQSLHPKIRFILPWFSGQSKSYVVIDTTGQGSYILLIIVFLPIMDIARCVHLFLLLPEYDYILNWPVDSVAVAETAVVVLLIIYVGVAMVQVHMIYVLLRKSDNKQYYINRIESH
jgi:hypothetical protein